MSTISFAIVPLPVDGLGHQVQPGSPGMVTIFAPGKVPLSMSLSAHDPCKTSITRGCRLEGCGGASVAFVILDLLEQYSIRGTN